MDPQNQQPIQPSDMPPPPKIGNPSLDIITPEPTQIARSRHRISRTKKIIIFVAVFIVAAFLLFWFAVPQNIIAIAGISNKTDSEILQIVKKDYPGVDSLHVIKKTTQYIERCIIGEGGSFFKFGCRVFEIGSYDYEGNFTSVGTKFAMGFKVILSTNNKNDIFLGDYQAVMSGGFLNNTKMPDQKWNSFVAFYNKLGRKSIYSLGNFDLFDRVVDGESTAVAGYKYKNLYTVCDKQPASVDTGDGYYMDAGGRCVVHSGSYTPVKQTTKNGIYIIYYDEAKNEWSVLTDDGKYFTTWVWHQLDTPVYNSRKGKTETFFDIDRLKDIDWSKSPIKPNTP